MLLFCVSFLGGGDVCVLYFGVCFLGWIVLGVFGLCLFGVMGWLCELWLWVCVVCGMVGVCGVRCWLVFFVVVFCYFVVVVGCFFGVFGGLVCLVFWGRCLLLGGGGLLLCIVGCFFPIGGVFVLGFLGLWLLFFCGCICLFCLCVWGVYGCCLICCCWFLVWFLGLLWLVFVVG